LEELVPCRGRRIEAKLLHRVDRVEEPAPRRVERHGVDVAVQRHGLYGPGKPVGAALLAPDIVQGLELPGLHDASDPEAVEQGQLRKVAASGGSEELLEG